MDKLPPDKIQQHQKGGDYLAEGADGCIFQAPGNWHCEKALKGYNPADKSVVSKIVPTSDTEGVILRAVRSIAKRHPEHYNLVRFIGECKPKLIFDKRSNLNGKPKVSGFSKTQKNYYKKHLRQLAKTEKACKSFRTDLKEQTPAELKGAYKMYVLGKYDKSYKEFCQDLEFRFYSKDKVADIIYEAHIPFVETLENLINDPVYTVINFDLHSKNIVVFKDPHPGKKVEKDFEVGISDFGRAVLRKKSTPYTPKVFMEWDKPYIDTFLIRDQKENLGETFSKFNQFSLEGRLLNYILTNINRGNKKGETLWLERMYNSEYIKRVINKELDVYDTLLFYLPSFIKSVKKSAKYKKYEKGLELCVQGLGDMPPEIQFRILDTNPNIQEFWDFQKTRSHLPTALGVYLMRGLRAANYSRDEIREILRNPEQTKIYVPEKFRLLISKYISYMMQPFLD